MPLRTVGVAIGLPDPVASELSAWRAKVGDRQAFKVPPHVTLLPPMAVGPEAMADVSRHLGDVAAIAQPFSMHLHGTGTFRPISRVVFVAVASGIAYCELMEAELRCGPLAREIEFPYHPHVTVAQDVTEAQLDAAYAGLSDYDVRFPVDHFTQFEKDGLGSWRPVRHFPFGSG